MDSRTAKHQVWWLAQEQGAPEKPAEGMPCNGCGVCCLVEPCPMGALLSGTRKGACHWLRWDAAVKLYRCGVLVDTAGEQVWWKRAIHRLARRWMAASVGCDCSLEVEKPGEGAVAPPPD